MTGWLNFDEVERWAAEARARDAADARVRERWLRRQAEEEAAFAGLLVSLAERGVPVIVATTGGRHHVGRVEAVGADFTVVTTTGDRSTLVSLAAVAAVRLTGPRGGSREERRDRPGAGGTAEPGGGVARLGPSGPPSGVMGAAADASPDSRDRRVTVTMADVIGHAVESRPRVQVFAASAGLSGELVALGTDVLTVQTDGNPPGLTYVRLASVSELSFLDSG